MYIEVVQTVAIMGVMGSLQRTMAPLEMWAIRQQDYANTHANVISNPKGLKTWHDS